MADQPRPDDRTPEEPDAPAEDPRDEAANAPALDTAAPAAAGAGGKLTTPDDDDDPLEKR